jgi:hypothetical protein
MAKAGRRKDYHFDVDLLMRIDSSENTGAVSKGRSSTAARGSS